MRPSRAMWMAWLLALGGGLAVLGASWLVLGHPCLQGGPCTSPTVTVAAGLALLGTALAVIGGLAATYLAVRGSRPR